MSEKMKKKWARRKLHELAEGLDKEVAAALGLVDRNFATLEGRMSDMRETLHRRILTLEKWHATLAVPIREKSFEHDVINMGAVCAARHSSHQLEEKALHAKIDEREHRRERANSRLDEKDRQLRVLFLDRERVLNARCAELDQALTAALVRIAALEDGGKVDAAPMLDKPEPESAQSAEPKEWIWRPSISRMRGAIGGETAPSSTLAPSGVPEGDDPYPDPD